MGSTLKRSCRTIGVLALAAALSLSPVAYGQAAKGPIAGSTAAPVEVANGAMPVAQQNALVQKYCVVCHTDAKPTGGLSLETFDAAYPDPGLAAMMVGKLKTGAISAAGIPKPDRTTIDALMRALSAEAAGAGEWIVTRTQDRTTQPSVVTASVVQEAPSATNAVADLYRLTLTCHLDTHAAEIQLAWAPAPVPRTGGALTAAVDGKAPFTYKVDPGDGAAILYATKENSGAPRFAMPLPAQTLTVGNLFPGETVVFPFGGLSREVRQVLATCFPGSGTGQ